MANPSEVFCRKKNYAICLILRKFSIKVNGKIMLEAGEFHRPLAFIENPASHHITF